MGARQSAYLLDVHDPQHEQQPQDLGQEQGQEQGEGEAVPGAHSERPRPPPLNLTAPPAPPHPRRRTPLCSGLDTVDIASTHPHSPMQSPAATGLVDVWIIAGQSNAVGYNAADGSAIPAAAQPLPGLVLSYDSSGTWLDAAPNVHAGVHGYSREMGPSCGPAMAFGRTLVALGLSGRVGLVAAAKGAASLYHDWRPVGGGDLYGAMIARTKAALAAPMPGGGSGRLRGMIWVQGEADAEEKLGPGPSEAYDANFTAFVHAVRRDLSSYHAQLPVLLGVMPVRKRDCFPYLAAVRQAQLGLTMSGLLRLDLAGYEFFEEYGGYHVHLTKDGAAALGAAMAHAYYSAVVRAGLPRRPSEAAAAAAGLAFTPRIDGRSGGGTGGGGGDLGSVGGTSGGGGTCGGGDLGGGGGTGGGGTCGGGDLGGGGGAAAAAGGWGAAPSPSVAVYATDASGVAATAAAVMPGSNGGVPDGVLSAAAPEGHAGRGVSEGPAPAPSPVGEDLGGEGGRLALAAEEGEGLEGAEGTEGAEGA